MNKSYTVAALVIGLLALVELSHQFMGMTAEEIATNRPSIHNPEHDADLAQTDALPEGPVELPEPWGSPDALVRIKVFVTADNECDVTTIDAIQEIAQKHGEEQVYVTFNDLLDKDVQAEAWEAKISCKSGLTINDQSKFILPERGLKGTVLLDGPVGEMNYKLEDVEAIIAHLLKAED